MGSYCRIFPACLEPSMLQLYSGPTWPERSHNALCIWNCRIPETKYLQIEKHSHQKAQDPYVLYMERSTE